MATTHEVRGVTVFKVPSLNAGLTYARDPGEEASMTYKAGALLEVDSSSKELEEMAASDTTLVTGVAAKTLPIRQDRKCRIGRLMTRICLL